MHKRIVHKKTNNYNFNLLFKMIKKKMFDKFKNQIKKKRKINL